MFNRESVDNSLIPSDPRFGCGPTLIPPAHLQNMLDSGPHLIGTSHRSKGIRNLVKEIQDGLKKYFELPDGYEVLLGNGGATYLFDAIGLGMTLKKSVHYTCGEFSQKWFKSHKNIPWIEAEEISVEFGKGNTIRETHEADMVCTTLNETSTGVILADLPVVDDKTLLAVDATSGGAQVACDLSKVDLYFFSPQKVFAGEGGTFVAILSPKAIKRVEEVRSLENRYIPHIMCWKTTYDNALKNQTYNTPSITSLFLLNEQVKNLNSVGYQQVIEEGIKRANFFYQWAENHPKLSCYVDDSRYRSTAVATIDVDEDFNVNEFVKFLEEHRLAYGIGSYRKLNRNQFRISLFYSINFEDLKKLTELIEWGLSSQG